VSQSLTKGNSFVKESNAANQSNEKVDSILQEILQGSRSQQG